MTLANKVWTGLLLSVLALGGAFGGGYYVDMKQRRAVEKQLEEAKKKATEDGQKSDQLLLRARVRTQLIESSLAVMYMNYGMAFDRMVRVQSMAARLGLTKLQPEIDEINAMVMQQNSQVVTKMLSLADQFEPVVGLSLPTTPPPPTQLPKAAPAAATVKAAPAAATPLPATGGTPAEAGAAKELEPVREALRGAKEALLAGGEANEVARKLARALVLLNEAGDTTHDAELGAAIKAARGKDDARVRTSIDAVLAALRQP